MRTHSIGHRSFASTGTESTTKDEERREAALRQQFLCLVPAAGKLGTSMLVTRRQYRDEGCQLEFLLVEVPEQVPLSFPESDAALASNRCKDGFAQDVQAVMQQCTDVDTRLTLASGPDWTEEKLRAAGQEATDVRKLRSLYRTGKRPIEIPTPDGGRVIMLESAPLLFPTGRLCSIEAAVARLTRNAAILSAIRVLSWNGVTDSPSGLPSRMHVRRQSEPGPEVAQHFLHAMDSGDTVRLNASVAFSWVTGKPAVLEVVEWLDE